MRVEGQDRYPRFLNPEIPPQGGIEDPANKYTIVTVGAAFRPHPNVVAKVDRQLRRNDAETATSQWNVALGYMF